MKSGVYASGNPKVSVIIATSNNEEYIVDCLESVLSQTLKDIEVIVTDVLSKDGTQEIISGYEKRDKRVMGLSDSFGSIGHAKNAAIDKASASCIMIVEPEDSLRPNALQLLYEKMQEDTGYDLVKGLSERFGENVEPRMIKLSESAKQGRGRMYAMERWMMFSCAGMYRREFLCKNIRHYDQPGYGRQNIVVDFLGFAYAKSLTISDVVYRKRLDPKRFPVSDPRSVFDIIAEYRYLENLLKKSTDKWNKYRYAFWQSYFQSNLEMYELLIPELRPRLSARMYDDIKSAIKKGDFERDYFEESVRDLIEFLLDSPEKFDEEWKRRDWEHQVDRAQILVKLEMEEKAERIEEPESDIERESREFELTQKQMRIDRRWLTDEMARDLASLRLLLGVSPDEMSKIMGVSKAIYKSMETGKRKLSWNQYLTLLFMFHFNSRTGFVVDGLGLYPESLKERIVSGNDRNRY